MKRKIGRNELCYCGSNLKYKKCCLKKDEHDVSIPEPPGIDPVARFLEINFFDSFDMLRYHFFLEYSKIYSMWADDPIHSQNAFDTDKCAKLAIIAENHLREIASLYPQRFWIDSFRGMSLFGLYMIFGVPSFQALFENVIIGTLAIHKFSSLESPLDNSSEIKDILSPCSLKYAQENFSKDMGRFLGVINALILAQRNYRFAGKGGVLLQPSKLSIDDFPSFESFPKRSIFIVPGIKFEKNDLLEESVALYENRRDKQDQGLIAGLYQKQAAIHLINSNWWQIGTLSDTLSDFPKSLQTTVSYPKLALNIISQGYVVLPTEISNELELLFPFAESFTACFDFDFDSFRVMCQELTKFVYAETSFSELRVKETSEDGLTLTSTLSRHSLKARTAPRHLFDLFARAIFKAPRKNFVAALSSGLSVNRQKASELAEKFIDAFTYRPTNLLFHDLAPWLFYALDEEILAMDFLAMQSFWDLCLRTVTSVKGEISNFRGSIFEEQARGFLIRKLDLKQMNLPVKPGMKLKDNESDYGDIDFAFLWNNILINLDMKSWQKSPEYLRGDFLVIDNRQKELQHQISGKPSNLEKRGKKLLEILRHSEKTNNLSGVLSFLCVPHVEFISKKHSSLWYGNIPRVLTPDELTTILRDDEKFENLTEFLIK